MATAARDLLSVWGRENRVYAPGALDEDENIVTLSSEQNLAVELALGHWQGITFGHLSMSRGSEARRLKEYFMDQIVRSFERLADPYESISGEDPFEYRSVPYRGGRTLRARVERVDPSPPSPIDDD
jgi:hypothetical protein